MHITRNTLALVLAMTTAPASTLQAQERPGSVLDRAIRAAGGEATLRDHRRIEWSGLGVVHIPNRDIVIRGWWDLQPPDSAVVDTYDTTRGPATTRTLIVAGPRGWLLRDTTFTPLPEDLLAEERHQFYLYSLLRLVPLKEKGVKLRPVFPDSMGNAGFTVERADRLPVTMYFDSAGRVMRLVTRFALPGPVAGDPQVVLLHGTSEVEGFRWFRRIEILRAGKPYFDMDIDSLKVQRGISDSLLEGPPRRSP